MARSSTEAECKGLCGRGLQGWSLIAPCQMYTLPFSTYYYEHICSVSGSGVPVPVVNFTLQGTRYLINPAQTQITWMNCSIMFSISMNSTYGIKALLENSSGLSLSPRPCYMNVKASVDKPTINHPMALIRTEGKAPESG